MASVPDDAWQWITPNVDDTPHLLGRTVSDDEHDVFFPCESRISKKWGTFVENGVIRQLKGVFGLLYYANQVSSDGTMVAFDDAHLNHYAEADAIVASSIRTMTPIPVHMVASGTDYCWGVGVMIGTDFNGFNGRRRFVVRRISDFPIDMNKNFLRHFDEYSGEEPTSLLEMTWSTFFSSLGVQHISRAASIRVAMSDEKTRRFNPAFYLPLMFTFVHVMSNYPTESEKKVAHAVAASWGMNVILFYESPMVLLSQESCSHSPRGIIFYPDGRLADGVVWRLNTESQVAEYAEQTQVDDASATGERICAAHEDVLRWWGDIVRDEQ